MSVYCLNCFSSIAPGARVCPCCGAPITSWGATIPQLADAKGKNLQDTECLAHEVRQWIDDFGRREWVTEQVVALGGQAIMPLRRYLAGGAQTIPQGRLFAVAMLARLSSSEALAGLREVLHGAALADLPFCKQDAERQVKDAVIQALAKRSFSCKVADLMYAVAHEHLPSAVVLAGEQGIVELAPVLVAMLKDDVLERAAAYALEQFGDVGRNVVLSTLAAWFEGARTNVRDRLGVVRALMLLQETLGDIPSWVSVRARGDTHPAIRAAGALLTDRGPGHVAMLVRGGISDYAPLAMACRERLIGYDEEFVPAAIDALTRNREPDMYGNQHALARSEVQWLGTECLKRAAVSSVALSGVLTDMREDALIATLTCATPVSMEVLQALSTHTSALVRQTAAWRASGLPRPGDGGPSTGHSPRRKRSWRAPVAGR